MLFLSDVNVAEFAAKPGKLRRVYNAAEKSLRRKTVRRAGYIGLVAGGLLGYGTARNMGVGAGLSTLTALEGASRGATLASLGAVGTLWVANKLKGKRRRRRY